MLSHQTLEEKRGFTLIELLLVIGIIAILSAIVIIAINPSLQLAKTRNVQRQHNIKSILEAFTQFQLDHNGSYSDPAVPLGADCSVPLAPAPPRKVCVPTMTEITCDFGAPGDGNGCVYLSNFSRYIVSFPGDPQDTTGGDNDNSFDYTVLLTDNRRHFSVFAPNTEMPPATAILTVTR